MFFVPGCPKIERFADPVADLGKRPRKDKEKKKIKKNKGSR